jgi:signal peptidase I
MQISIHKNPWLAGILSFWIWGLGQFYCGKTKRGILLILAYIPAMLIFMGLFLFPFPILNVVLPLTFLSSVYFYIVGDAIILAREYIPSSNAQTYNKWYLYILFIGFSFLLSEYLGTTIKNHFIQFYKFPAGSMSPAILNGDYIMTQKWPYKKSEVHRGDVIVFPYPKDESRLFIKRVVSLPGEKLKIVKQRVFINDRALDEPYALHSQPVGDSPLVPRDDLDSIIIPEGHVFVMGDNRENSEDSRYWGFLKISKIVGEVKMIYWSNINSWDQIRWDRIGKLVN